MAHILIIDDDRLLRNMLRRVLEPQTHTVFDAEDGEAGLRQLRNTAVDIVLCDIVMPNKEGLETIREIRQIQPSLPVIAMSGGGIIDPLPLAKRLGASQVMYKPFSAQELISVVESWVGRPRA